MADFSPKPDIRVPEQKTASLSFCDTTPKAFKQWVSLLPMANIGEVSRQLYHAIIELNQLFLSPQQRLQLLELIRVKIHFVCNELSRHFLGMAISLPEKQRKIANLSQALQLHLAGGYKLCVLEFLDTGGPDKHRKLLATATHRSLSELAGTVLRACQLYGPSPANSWLECHRLYRFALAHKLEHIDIDDAMLVQRRSSTINDAYKRVLLLGCARPNQLRQAELTQLYAMLELWTGLVDCQPGANGNSLFVVNMETDKSPIYRSLSSANSTTTTGNPIFFSFDSRDLSARINRRMSNADGIDDEELSLPANANETLLCHLGQALGTLAKRNFNRIASQGSLELCIGLTAAHYFMADRTVLDDFVRRPDLEGSANNVFIRSSIRKNDAWAGAPDAEDQSGSILASDTAINFQSPSTNATATLKNLPRACRAQLINTSPGGYCVAWDNSMPNSLQAGEILGVREKGSQPWGVAVVRWIRQVKNEGTEVGLELQAPRAKPCAVRLIQRQGSSSEYLRGLLLPEISVINQPATLIVPRMPFQSGSRISILLDDTEEEGQLLKKLMTTGSINQFEVKLHAAGLTSSITKPALVASEDEFDSLWPSL